MIFIRYLLAIALGGAVTFGLLFLMQLLIATGNSELSDSGSGHMVDFVRVKRDETVQRKKLKPRKPPTPEEPPPDLAPPEQDTSFEGDGGDVLSIPAAPVVSPDVGVDTTLGVGIGFGASDGEYLPIVKVKPIYPPAALQRKIEGWVIIEFVVTKNGSVRDPVIIEYDPLPIFNKSALKAAVKFKYKPRIVNGEPIEVAGVRNKIIFKIDQ